MREELILVPNAERIGVPDLVAEKASVAVEGPVRSKVSKSKRS